MPVAISENYTNTLIKASILTQNLLHMRICGSIICDAELPVWIKLTEYRINSSAKPDLRGVVGGENYGYKGATSKLGDMRLDRLPVGGMDGVVKGNPSFISHIAVCEMQKCLLKSGPPLSLKDAPSVTYQAQGVSSATKRNERLAECERDLITSSCTVSRAIKHQRNH